MIPLMKQKISFFLLIAFVLAACAPSAQAPVDAQSPQSVLATEVLPTLDIPIPTLTAVPPTSTSVPQMLTLSGADCASADAVKLGQSIADGYAFTNVEEVLTWFCNGAEFEDILVALQTEEITDTPAEDMLALLADGLTWDDIWQAIGLTDE